MAKQLQAQGKTVDSVERVVNENRRLNATLAELQNEYTSKINQANAIMAEQNAQNNQMRNDAEMMALMMADSELNGQK